MRSFFNFSSLLCTLLAARRLLRLIPLAILSCRSRVTGPSKENCGRQVTNQLILRETHVAAVGGAGEGKLDTRGNN